MIIVTVTAAVKRNKSSSSSSEMFSILTVNQTKTMGALIDWMDEVMPLNLV